MQAFFFADGGLLALGCNIFNLGFLPAFIAYPLIYRTIAGDQHGTARAWVAAMAAAIVSLQLGAFGVVMETTVSGIAQLPFRTFALLMGAIHLAIGACEGLATAATVSFVARAHPEALSPTPRAEASIHRHSVLIGFAFAAIVMGGVLSWFASSRPDGLEWSIARITGTQGISRSESELHSSLNAFQKNTAILPEYQFKAASSEPATQAVPVSEPWPAVKGETSVSGIVGGLVILAAIGLVGYALKARPAVAPYLREKKITATGDSGKE